MESHINLKTSDSNTIIDAILDIFMVVVVFVHKGDSSFICNIFHSNDLQNE